jgi:hypothetical protein
VAVATPSVADQVRAERMRRVAMGTLAAVTSIVVGVAVGAIVSSGHLVAVFFLPALALPLLFWRWPATGVVTLLGAATVFEQFKYAIAGTQLDAFTDRVPLFASLQGGFRLSGFVMSPIDIAVGLMILVWLTRGLTNRSLRVPRTSLAACLGVLLALMLIALLRGLGLGGDQTRAALWEARPWIYLGATYLVSSQFMTSRRALNAVLWTFVLGSGFKAVQGVYIFFGTRNLAPPPDAILAHEESFFFGIFTMLALSLWVYRQRGWLRITATSLLPLVLLADLGNARRTAWLILGADLLVMAVLAYVALPQRRSVIRRFATVLLVVSIVYFPLEWNSTSTFAQPARAVRSAFAPSARDTLSNAYRQQEDTNLAAMIARYSPFGTGFGVQINYNVAPIVDISNVDSFIGYVPHNGVLYVWMRGGLPGELALWMFVAAALLLAIRATRARDPMVAVLGALVACATVAWVIQGYDDMGFYFFRIALAMGCLLGLLEAAMRREARERQAAQGERPTELSRAA